jgi:PKD repeat protein
MKRFRLLLIALFLGTITYGQEWIEGMHDHSVNVYEVQKKFDAYWEEVKNDAQRTNENFRPGKTGPAFGFPQFKRWENFWIPRVSGSDGMRPDPGQLAQTIFGATAAASSSTQNAGDWQAIGPFDAPNSNSWTGIGRINCVAFHPTNTNIIWAGAPSGGLWKSTDGGTTWSTNTDLLPNLGVSSIAIDPIHPDTMYIATGDRDGGDTYSFGILKSVDGGQSWNTTGLTYSVTQTTRIGAVRVVPDSTNVIIAATRTGIFRSTDYGSSWTGIEPGAFNTLAADPQNPHIIFAGTTGSQGRVYRSTDRGISWTRLTSGLPNSGVNRVEIAVSAQDSNYIYAVFSASNNGFGGLYRSTNGGNTWTLRSSTPNILGWSANGTGSGGQGWYDLCIAVSPTNKNTIFVGGVNVWRNNAGGNSQGWNCVGHWYGQNGVPIVHADIHYFNWQPGTNHLWLGTDGGVYKTTNLGNSWIDYKDGMNITQYYKISQSLTNPTLIVGGSQDNGTHRQLGLNWDIVRGGDGMDNGIDPDNNQIMYASVYYGDFSKSSNGGNSFFPMNIPVAGQGNWVTPFVIDPTNSNILYAGYSRLWRSTNKGNSWQATSNGSIGGANIDDIAVAPSNNQVLYVSINQFLYRSTNNGNNWSLISQGIPGSTHITGIAVSATDADHVWVTKTGYTSNQKVFESFDGGQTWSNRSNSLPNLPVNCIVYEEGSFDAVYIGTDVGVYYRDATMNSWVPYMLGLPNVIVSDLEIYYVDAKIRAGTYGRGVWEASLYSSFFGSPEANFQAQPFSTCNTSDTVTLQDASLYGPTNWSWSIYPNTVTFVNGTSDSSQNPQIVFNALGEYAITLTVSNAYNADSKTVARAVSVGGKPLPFTEDFENSSFAEQWQINNADNGITWSPALVAGSSPGNQAIFLDFYNYNAQGERDELISPALSFDGYSNINLTFDHAYAQYTASSRDSLQVFISTDCGQSWTLLQTYVETGNSGWSTVSSSTAAFVPANTTDWCGPLSGASCKTINLNAYTGNSGVRIKFVAINDYGNNLYLDNINITGTPTNKPTADFIGDTAGCSVNAFSFYDVSSNSPTAWSWSFPGGTPSSSTLPNPQITYASGGTYAVTLQATNAAGTDTLTRTSYVNVDQALIPSASITASATSICANETLVITASASNGGLNPYYIWYRNGLFEEAGTDSLVINNAADGDVFLAVMRPDESCVTNDSVVSNTVFISVDPLPTVNLNSFSPVCAGDAPFVLIGGTPTGGSYSGTGVSGGLFNPQIAGVGGHIITYTYSDPATGCTNTATKNIIVNNSPPKPVVTYTNYVLKADPITSSYTYQWLDGAGNPIPGATDTIYIPTATGDYSVQITFLNGCTNVSDAYSVTEIGLNEFTLQQGIGLYPNPASERIHVQIMLDAPADITFIIYDIAGKLLLQEERSLDIGQQSIPLNVADLPAGTYLIEVTDGENQIQEQFIKQ